MKFKYFIFFVLISSILCINAFAEVIESTNENGDTVYTSSLLTPEENSALLETQEILNTVNSRAFDSASSDSQLVSVQSSNYSITASDSNGLKAIILDLIGDYDTVVTDYTYQTSSTYYQHSIDIQPDYAWMASFIIFALVIYCIFRLGGSLFCSL